MSGQWRREAVRQLRRAMFHLPPEHREEPRDPSYIYRGAKAPRTVMVTMLEIQPDAIGEILDRTSEQFGMAFRLIFLTDAEDLTALLVRGAIFEYVPNAMRRRLHADKLDWPLYLAERWTLLQAKWQPVRILSYGEPMEAIVANRDASAPS